LITIRRKEIKDGRLRLPLLPQRIKSILSPQKKRIKSGILLKGEEELPMGIQWI